MPQPIATPNDLLDESAAVSEGTPERTTHQPQASQTVDHVESLDRTIDHGPAAAPSAESLPCVPGYEILRTLGRGGMGVVYLARHQALNRQVALKMILASRHGGSDPFSRFRAEAETVARLQHPNIVQVYDIGEADGYPYFSLEFVEGGSLAEQLRGTPQVPAKAAELASILANAVHAAHRGGVIHRDLKPANILLTPDGQPKVADFGLAKQMEGPSSQTVSGSILGTPSYMAPEQADGRIHDVGPRSDVYALGAILYESLTGRPPFRGATMLETLEQVRTEEPVAPTSLQPKTPRDLETICLKCLQKEPAKRYDSAEALGDDLRRFLRHEPIRARSVTAGERLARWRRRNPAVAALAATSAAILIVGLVVTSSLAVLASRRADRIEAMNADLLAATKESDDRGEIALKTLESVVQDIQTELANVPNAQKLRGRLLTKAMDGLQRLDEKLRTQKRADRNTALALLSMAEVFRQAGNEAGPKGPAAANQLYERSIDLFEKLRAETPKSTELQGQLAEAFLLYGMNLAHTDDSGWEVTPESTAQLKERPLMKKALTVHRQAADLRRRIRAAMPDDPTATRELARALNEWGYQEVRAGDVETTRQLFEEARALLQPLLSAEPHNVANRLIYGKCTERLGDLYFDMKDDAARSKVHYTEALELFKRLAAEQPDDAVIQMACANCWSRMADCHRAFKDVPASLVCSQQELAITQKLEKAYPDNVQIVMDCSSSYDHNYRDNYMLGNFEVARAMVQKAFDVRLPILDADGDNHRNISRLVRTTKRLGGIHQKLDYDTEAIAAYEAGLSRLTAYVQRTGDPSLDKDIATIKDELAKCRMRVE